jgi:hypothetical protein
MSDEMRQENNIVDKNTESTIESEKAEEIKSENEGEQTEVNEDSETPETKESKVLTQEDLAREVKRAQAIAERRAKRELDAKYSAELEKFKTNAEVQQRQNVYNQPQQNIQQPSPDHVWDNNLGWIHKDMSLPEYSQAVNQALMGLENDPNRSTVPSSNVVQPQTATSVPPAQKEDVKASNKALEQIDECMEDLGDQFKDDLIAGIKGGIITPHMINAAALAPDGVKEFYNWFKKEFTTVSKISQLSPMEQQARIWDFNAERTVKKQPKVESKITPQPESLKSNGDVNNSSAESSYLKKKREAEHQIWGK